MEDNKSTRLEISYRAASLLVPYENNAKIHEEDQIDQIAGHGRLRAAQKMGMEQVPTVELSHLSEAQKRAYILADNRLAEVNTSWDFDLVSIELEALQADGFEIELTGFDDEFLDATPATDLEGENPGDKYKETHSLIVLCADSDEQELLFNRLTEMGLTLKVVSN